ncbi:uncharacterized protein [Prorops nasuta]|uniref:uncharacterized protein n=1 Tax=Prorops nasuta TaxID=863751 RepID=UPI0034CE5CF4
MRGEYNLQEGGSRSLQYIAALTGNLCVMSALSVLGWASSALVKLEQNPVNPDNPLGVAITVDETAWIASLCLIGGFVGSLTCGYLVDRIGRKWMTLSASVPLLIGWILTGTAKNIVQIYIARVIMGFGMSFPFITLPMYLGEIAETNVRGCLGSMVQTYITLGLLYAYVIGPYVSYTTFAMACGALPVIFFVTFCFMPESPYFLLHVGRKQEAIESLAKFRGKKPDDVLEEAEEIERLVDEAYRDQKGFKELFTVKANRKALLYSSTLSSLQQLTGIDVILIYLETIFVESQVGFSSSMSAIIVGVVQMLASFVTPFIVDSYGRRIILIVSGIGEVISLTALGLYFSLKNIDESYASCVSWLPLVSLVAFIACYGCGWGSIPFTVLGEIFASNVKSRATTIIICLMWTLDFFLTKFTADLVVVAGEETMFYLYAGFCFIGVMFVLLFLPETKGKTFQQIQDELNNIPLPDTKDNESCVPSSRYRHKLCKCHELERIRISLNGVLKRNMDSSEVSKGNEDKKGSRALQYTAAATANLCIMASISVLGWTSPVTAKLEKDDPISVDNPLGISITQDESSWIGSLVPMGAIFGSFAAGYLGETCGRKRALLLSSIPLLTGWILIASATDLTVIYVARLIFGFALSFPFTVLPMYIGEIAETRIRGQLGSFIQIFFTFGLLYSYCIGPYVSYIGFSIACAFLTILFVVSFIGMPESPYYYFSRGDKEKAKKALARLRGKNVDDVQQEADEIELIVDEAYRSQATYKELVTVKANRKALIYTCLLTCFQQLTGVDVVLFYMESIFVAAGSNLSTSVSTIIVGVVQMVASFLTPLIVDTVGRKILLVWSGIGEVMTLGALGLYFHLKTVDEAYVNDIKWLPILSLIIFIATYSVGWGPLPWTIMGEMFASNVKSKASSVTVCVSWGLDFFVTKFAINISEAFGSHITFYGFSVFCILSVFFTVVFLPETKGKSFQDIQKELHKIEPDIIEFKIFYT